MFPSLCFLNNQLKSNIPEAASGGGKPLIPLRGCQHVGSSRSQGEVRPGRRGRCEEAAGLEKACGRAKKGARGAWTEPRQEVRAGRSWVPQSRADTGFKCQQLLGSVTPGCGDNGTEGWGWGPWGAGDIYTLPPGDIPRSSRSGQHQFPESLGRPPEPRRLLWQRAGEPRPAGQAGSPKAGTSGPLRTDRCCRAGPTPGQPGESFAAPQAGGSGHR